MVSQVTPSVEVGPACAERAEELFRQHQREIYCHTDLLFARLLIGQWIACIIIALAVSPESWSGQASAIHIHVWASIFFGGAITLFPLWLIWMWRGAAVTRHVIAVAQMLMSALIISLSGGRIETHFHVFGSLVILSFYRDWRVLIPATAIVAIDHFVRGIYWPYSVYGVLSASPFRSLEHAAWVLFQDVFLLISCRRSISEMQSIANRTAALEASEQDFRQLFEEAPIGMAVVDLDDRFQQANTALREMIGYSEDELRRRTSFDITAPDEINRSRHLARELIEGRAAHRIEKRYRRKNGEEIWCTRTGCVIRDPAGGQPRHCLIMVEDITERKRAEAALREAKDEADRANRAKSEFLSRMSHELRTPLNAILGFGQLLERQSANETQRTRINHIVSAGRHLLGLINEVLDISRIESGRLQLSLEPVCLGTVLGETLDLMRPLAEERSIEIMIPERLDPTIHVLGDHQRLKQVLLNLLTNAVKYTGIGGVVTVAVAVNTNDGGRVRLSVTDTGVGIPPEKRSRLFTPFDRLDAEFSAVQGTGLGLAVSRRLIEAMNGSIAVESEVGRGSTFLIELIQAASPLAGLPGQSVPAMEKKKMAAVQNDISILYIEDNSSNIALTEQVLENCKGIQLLTAETGQAGLDSVRKQCPDLILLDLHLPDLPGWDVLAHLRAHEETRHIPVIVISADATESQIKRLLAAGASAYLTKPIDLPEFYETLQKTLAARRQPLAA